MYKIYIDIHQTHFIDAVLTDEIHGINRMITGRFIELLENYPIVLN
jgi:hypothetical protein